VDAFWIAAVLTAHADLQSFTRLAAFINCDLHQPAHAIRIDAGKRIVPQQSGLQVMHKETGLGVVAGDAVGGLCQVVGAE